jgi:hypothetical protein
MKLAVACLVIGFLLGRWSREPVAVVDRDGPVEWQW